MPSPSNLLKKANTAKYVLNPENGGQLLKNPAYYMQPPTANSAAWSPEQPAPQSYRPYPFQEPAPANAPPPMPPQYGYAPAQAFTPPPQYGYTAPQQPMPPQYGYAPAYSMPTPPMAAPMPVPTNGAPLVHNADMQVSVQPPNIPAPIINRNPSIYKDIMKKHDRAAAQYPKQAAKTDQ